MTRFLRRFGNKEQDPASEYVEFDAILDDGDSEAESNQQRLNSIWRNENVDASYEHIVQHVQKQEYQPSSTKNEAIHHKSAHSHGARSMPVNMHEHIINTKSQFNKIFASSFVSENIVTFGTKDNKLMLLDVTKGKICQIRLPNPEKSFDYNQNLDGSVESAKSKDKSDSCGIHDLKFNLNNNLLISGGYQPQDVALFRYDNDVHHVGPRKFSHTLLPLATLKFHKDWIFAMDFIDDNHIVAGGKDGQLSIWDVSQIDQQYETYRRTHGLKVYNQTDLVSEPYKIESQGFDDMYGMTDSELQQSLLSHPSDDMDDAWGEFDNDVDQGHSAKLSTKQKHTTISQDRSNVPILRKPVQFTKNRFHRIRALKAFSKSTSLSHSQCVVTLATSGEVQIYDVSRSKPLFQEFLPYRKEAVCVEINQEKGQIIVGSQSNVQIFDPRAKINASLQVIDSVDKNWGCRTISCHTGLLTIGGGLGRLSFYDLRTNQYINCESKQDKQNDVANDKMVNCRTMDKGWIKQDDVYNNIFALHGLPTPTAVYTHCYNPQRSKLFAAGGPTPYGLFGSAASVYF